MEIGKTYFAVKHTFFAWIRRFLELHMQHLITFSGKIKAQGQNLDPDHTCIKSDK